MKKFKNNPRTITQASLQNLADNYDELGDLSGFTHDEKTDQIITGNQRAKVISINDCKIEIEEEYEKPNRQGTIAIGFVIYNGQRFNYRKVRWKDKQIKKALILANVESGTWQFDFEDDYWNDTELQEWGVDAEFMPEPEFAPGGDNNNNGGDDGLNYPGAPGTAKQIKMVQLFFDQDDKPNFIKFVEELEKHYGTDNLSDTVYEAIEEAVKLV